TFFGLLLTPVFYVVIRWFIERKQSQPAPQPQVSRVVHMLVLLTGLLGMLNGCKAVGPDYRDPVVPVPAGFANQEQAGVSTAAVEVSWWRGFQDEQLNQLVTQALAQNHNIRIATARLQEARALRVETGFDRFPTVTTQETYTRQHLSEAAAGSKDRDS